MKYTAEELKFQAKIKRDREERQERADKAAADKRAADRGRLEESVRAEFLSRPGATEADWGRLGPALVDDALLSGAHSSAVKADAPTSRRQF